MCTLLASPCPAPQPKARQCSKMDLRSWPHKGQPSTLLPWTISSIEQCWSYPLYSAMWDSSLDLRPPALYRFMAPSFGDSPMCFVGEFFYFVATSLRFPVASLHVSAAPFASLLLFYQLGRTCSTFDSIAAFLRFVLLDLVVSCSFNWASV